MKGRIILVGMLLTTFVAICQTPANNSVEEVLEWNEYYNLTWADFQGKRPGDAAGDAGTVVRIKAKPFLVKDEVHYDVLALFVRNKSWSDAQSKALLEHERLHFDIAELYARKIRQRIADLRKRKINKIETINLAIEELLQESNQVDIQYDVETLHGTMLQKQDEWRKKINQELASLSKFKKKKRVISAG